MTTPSKYQEIELGVAHDVDYVVVWRCSEMSSDFSSKAMKLKLSFRAAILNASQACPAKLGFRGGLITSTHTALAQSSKQYHTDKMVENWKINTIIAVLERASRVN